MKKKSLLSVLICLLAAVLVTGCSTGTPVKNGSETLPDHSSPLSEEEKSGSRLFQRKSKAASLEAAKG